MKPDEAPLPAPPGLRAGARFALAPGLPRNDVGHEKGTRGDVVDSRAYRRPTRITRRHLFRVGQRAARSVPERRSAKFRRASRFLLVQGRQRAQASDCAIAFVGLPVSQGGRSLSGGAFLVSHAPCNQPASRPVDMVFGLVGRGAPPWTIRGSWPAPRPHKFFFVQTAFNIAMLPRLREENTLGENTMIKLIAAAAFSWPSQLRRTR